MHTFLIKKKLQYWEKGHLEIQSSTHTNITFSHTKQTFQLCFLG